MSPQYKQFNKTVALGLAIIGSIGLLSCSKNELRNRLIQTNQPLVSGQRWAGGDYHVDIYVCPEWITERRRVSVNLDDGKVKEIQLTPEMKDGVQLRIRGHAPNQTGNLYLHVRLVK